MTTDIKELVCYYVNKYSLVTASEDKYLEIGCSLIDSGAYVNKIYENGNTALIDAVENGETHIVKILIAALADINIQNKFGNTALHCSAKNGNLVVVEALITARAMINVTNESGWTPLHYCSSHGFLSIVNALVAAGADIQKKEKNGVTALYLASEKNHLDIVEALVSAGADIDEENRGATPYQVAVAENRRETCKLLAHFSTLAKDSCIAMHLASEWGFLNIVKDLIASGNDVNGKSMCGSTPLHLASEHGHVDIAKALVLAGADIIQENDKGLTPIHLAYGVSQKEICKFMIKYTALMNYGTRKKNIFIRRLKLMGFIFYWGECEKRIKGLKKMKLGNSSVSIFKFLSEPDENKVAFYSSEEHFGVMKEIQGARFRDKLGMYADIFEAQFRKGSERSSLLLKNEELMTKTFPKRLPFEIIRKIGEYLSNYDLENLNRSLTFKRRVKPVPLQMSNSLNRQYITID